MITRNALPIERNFWGFPAAWLAGAASRTSRTLPLWVPVLVVDLPGGLIRLALGAAADAARRPAASIITEPRRAGPSPLLLVRFHTFNGLAWQERRCWSVTAGLKLLETQDAPRHLHHHVLIIYFVSPGGAPGEATLSGCWPI